MGSVFSLPGLTACNRQYFELLDGFTGFYWILLDFTGRIQTFTELFKKLSVYTDLCIWILSWTHHAEFVVHDCPAIQHRYDRLLWLSLTEGCKLLQCLGVESEMEKEKGREREGAKEKAWENCFSWSEVKPISKSKYPLANQWIQRFGPNKECVITPARN